VIESQEPVPLSGEMHLSENNANTPTRISCLGATGKILLDQADQFGGGVRLRRDAMSIDAPTVDLVLGYKKSNKSPILKLLLSKLDELVARVSKRE
jgi:hypothetical protein